MSDQDQNNQPKETNLTFIGQIKEALVMGRNPFSIRLPETTQMDGGTRPMVYIDDDPEGRWAN